MLGAALSSIGGLDCSFGNAETPTSEIASADNGAKGCESDDFGVCCCSGLDAITPDELKLEIAMLFTSSKLNGHP